MVTRERLIAVLDTITVLSYESYCNKDDDILDCLDQASNWVSAAIGKQAKCVLLSKFNLTFEEKQLLKNGQTYQAGGHIYNRNKLTVIKEYRTRTGLGLVDSKNAVEKWAKENGVA
jgi:ribosomal protein L7/L12